MDSSYVFFFKQKTAYEMRISDWSSDVCSSDLDHGAGADAGQDRASRHSRADGAGAADAAFAAVAVRAAYLDDQDQPGQDPRSDWQGWRDHPVDHQGNRHADRHLRRRHDQDRGSRRQRSDERRVGKEGDTTRRLGWWA